MEVNSKPAVIDLKKGPQEGDPNHCGLCKARVEEAILAERRLQSRATTKEVIGNIERALFAAADQVPEDLIPEDYLRVAKAWLKSGEVVRARHMYSRACTDRRFEHDLLDSEEAETLGVSVYPSSQPMRERWVMPPEVPRIYNGMGLISCCPGRVTAVDDDIVVIVVATIPDRGVFVRELARKEWDDLADFPPRLDLWIYLGWYVDNTHRIFPNTRG